MLPQQAVDLATSSPALKQMRDAAPQPDGSDGLIRVDVAVRDASGQPVTDLGANDFTILDDDQPQRLVSFHAANADTNAPYNVEVVFVLDEINLASDQAKQAEHAVAEYLQSSMGDLPHPALVYVLSSKGLAVTSGPSRDGNAIATELAIRKVMRLIWTADDVYQLSRFRGIAIRNARNNFSLNALGSIVVEERSRPGRKLVIWMGNGWPIGEGCEDSFDYITEFSTRMREGRVVLSGISAWPNPADRVFDNKESLKGVATERQKNSWALSLQVLAPQSGGEVLTGRKDLERALEETIDTEGAYYTLSFDPPRARTADEYQPLHALLKDASLTVKTSASYYNQPIFYDDPPVPAMRVSVAELDALLQTFHGVSDGDAAKRLESLELTERMSAKQLDDWKERLHGSKTKAALVSVADASSFLDPPEVQAPMAAPSIEEQRRMLAKTVEYVSKAMVRLPNFYAVRTIHQYRQPQQKESESWKVPPGDQLLQPKGTLSATMFYRNGAEVGGRQRNGPQERLGAGRDECHGRALVRVGHQGVIAIAGHGHARDVRSNSQHGDRGCGAKPAGMARLGAACKRNARCFQIRRAASPIALRSVVLLPGRGQRATVFRKLSAYHGEIQIDPKTGAIVRLTVQADNGPRQPIDRSDILVDYAPQTLGNVEYMCPSRSVTIWRGRRSEMVHEWNESFRAYGPFVTMMDDVSFDRYHLFRGEARILTGDEALAPER